ncbi:MAG TPA: outer membrane beta-barrel protein [Candidatus Baltobacteraceae bacterium]|jgi:hypothetical protein|nr:outer membrane beta-barrel protein [Candidatus Baltobacteraceae bacterium]
MLASLALVLVAQSTPSPAPTPTATPAPVITVAPEITLYHFWTSGAARPNTDVASGLLNFSVNSGNLHANATVGDYGFPTVGFPLIPDTADGANLELYSALPVAAISYNFDPHLSVAAGKFAALLGQESPFTYQNVNIQRGIGWAMEPVISRGIQFAYSNGPWSATLQENDAYYSGSFRAVEGLIGWTPSTNTSLQFAAIVPGSNVPGNVTTTVGNKAEYDLMFTRSIGKLQVLPYVLLVHSPASSVLGYTSAENAWAGVVLGTWKFSSQMSLAVRYESARNTSSTSDTSPNADLLGFGPGSSAISQTLTPTFHFGDAGVLRFEYSHVRASGLANQNRYGLEFGMMH